MTKESRAHGVYMKKTPAMIRPFFSLPVLLLAASCCFNAPKEDTSPEAVLALMRADTAWTHHLDSLSQEALGPGAVCLDPVSHSFLYGGRTWLFNQDWGGVLEVPSDYLIEDDLWQAELSFHGTRIRSPDSLILVAFYAGFQVISREEYLESIMVGLEDEGFTIQEWEEEEVLTIRARSAEGINYYGRHLYKSRDGIEYSVSVQWPDSKSPEAQEVIRMADRYPVGPDGTVFKGEALR